MNPRHVQNHIRFKSRAALAAAIAVFLCAHDAAAQNVRGPADASRIQRDIAPSLPKSKPAGTAPPEAAKGVNAPAGAEKISFVLKSVEVKGTTIFTSDELQKIYQSDLGSEIKVSRVWAIADAVTAKYRDKGYFLSRAYVPAQDIDGGHVKIGVVEGYVGEIVLDPAMAEKPLIRRIMRDVADQRPLSAQKLEELVLRLNDLPGLTFRSVLEPLPGGGEGAVKLTLIPEKEKAQGMAAFDNYGSRFLGPNEVSLSYRDSFIPMQDTTISFASDIPARELRYGMIEHKIPVSPAVSLNLSGSYVTAFPGSTLKSNNIDSVSTSLGLAFEYRPARQWLRNLTLGLGLYANDSESDVAGNNRLMRDHVRALRASVTYENADLWGGYNNMEFTLSRSLDMFGASQQGDLNLSRAQAKSGSMKLEADVMHQRYVATDYTMTLRAAGQWATNPLYSGEEFGYGGTQFGRAFDRSEITGDNGVAGSVEIGYISLPTWKSFSATPYSFFDYGKVWNKDTGVDPQSAASTGMGVRVSHPSGFAGNATIAQPLLHSQGQPLYGNGSNPRYLLQLSYGF